MAAAKRPRTSSSSSSSLTGTTTNSEIPNSTGGSGIITTTRTTTTSDASNGSQGSSLLRMAPPHKASRIHPSETNVIHDSGQGTEGGGGGGAHVQKNPTTTSTTMICNLPPTCHNRPTPIPNTVELERHYATFHAHVCVERQCGCVFPEERFLVLHQTENHDPIADLRRERNEKIFECFLAAPSCGRHFSTPRTRRLHLIQAHGYPKQYFFAITNKGIGGLLKKWGEGASLIRKDWKPRAGVPVPHHHQHHHYDHDRQMAIGGDREEEEEEEDDDEDGDGDEDEDGDLEATPRIRPRSMLSPTAHSQVVVPAAATAFGKGSSTATRAAAATTTTTTNDHQMASLTDNLNALSLVPNSVRFGRGGKTRGFARGAGPGAGGVRSNEDAGGRGIGNNNNTHMEVDGGGQLGPGSARHHDGPIIVGRGGGQPGRGMRSFPRGRRGFRS